MLDYIINQITKLSKSNFYRNVCIYCLQTRPSAEQVYSDLLFFILNGGDLELQLKAMQGLGQYKCVCVCVGVGVWV